MRLHVERSPATWERIVVLLGIPSIALGSAWLLVGLPTPACVFERITGWPCLTCGGTRCLRSALHGDMAEAFRWNPLVLLLAIAAMVVFAYALAVTIFRLPRLRVSVITARDLMGCRVAVVLLGAANWIYLAMHWSRSV